MGLKQATTFPNPAGQDLQSKSHCLHVVLVVKGIEERLGDIRWLLESMGTLHLSEPEAETTCHAFSTKSDEFLDVINSPETLHVGTRNAVRSR